MKYSLLAFIFGCIWMCWGCTPQKAHYIIGVSQCSDDEWREQMNKEIKREALFYPGVKVDICTAKDDNAKQIADVEDFIDKGVDLLIVSPNEAEAITPVIEKAYDKGIPVVLVDRRIYSNKYTAYVGADNYEIGFQVGNYIAERLHGKGQLVEIAGLHGSTSALERHRGIMAALKKTPDIKIVASADAAWLRVSAKEAFDSILNCHSHIDMVVSHNDRMAEGAYEAALEKGRQKEMLFVGIDALAGEGHGVEQVINGQLDATFIYPTGGDKVFEVAMNILQKKKYNRETILSTALVNRANARIMQMQTAHISQLDSKIEVLDKRLDAYLMRYSSQQMLLYACIIILILVGLLLFFVVRAFWTKNRMNEELSDQKRRLEEQRDQLVPEFGISLE